MTETHIELPVYKLYDVPEEADENSTELKMPYTNEYFVLEDLKGYSINSFYNKHNGKIVPGLSKLSNKENKYINIKMDKKDLMDLLRSKWAEKK